MPDARVTAEQLSLLARNLRATGDEGLRRELQRAVTDAARPVPAAIRAGLKPRLPDPYADVLDADLRITVSRRYSARDPGVTVRAVPRSGRRRSLSRLDRGVLSHPLFGDRSRWYDQPVRPGWFSGPAQEAGGVAREEIIAAMRRVAAAGTRRT